MMGGDAGKRGAGGDKIALVYAVGPIMSGKSQTDPFSGGVMGSTTIVEALRKANDDKQVAAIVLRIDSPGGSAVASDLVWREVRKLKKPVIASMGDVAASGGYYIAAPGRKIVAQRATLTGSIGVIMAKAITAGAYDKLDVGWDTVQRGEHAGLYSSLSSWEGEDRAAVEASLDHVYGEFKQRVAAGRKLPLERLDDLAGGRVWTGEQALQHRLVDAQGDFEFAFEQACLAAELPTDGTVRAVAISETGRRLYAEPVEATAARLAGKGSTAGGALALLADFVLGGELSRMFTRERIWMLADSLPRLRW
jgi:protease-4